MLRALINPSASLRCARIVSTTIRNRGGSGRGREAFGLDDARALCVEHDGVLLGACALHRPDRLASIDAPYVARIRSGSLTRGASSQGRSTEAELSLARLPALRFDPRVPEQHDFALVNGRAVLPGGLVERVNIGVCDGKIATISSAPLDAGETLDVAGLTIVPGLVDEHFHVFRGYGWETYEGATRAAAKGGVTTVVDMPLDRPPTLTARALRDKLDGIEEQCLVDYAVFGGYLESDPDEIPRRWPRRVLVRSSCSPAAPSSIAGVRQLLLRGGSAVQRVVRARTRAISSDIAQRGVERSRSAPEASSSSTMDTPRATWQEAGLTR